MTGCYDSPVNAFPLNLAMADVTVHAILPCADVQQYVGKCE